VLRFMIQDLLGIFIKPMANTESWVANLVATGLAVAGWGYFLYQGVVDPLGGINLVAAVWHCQPDAGGHCADSGHRGADQDAKAALCVGNGRSTIWLLIVTLVAGWQKLFHASPKISFLAHADKFSAAAAKGEMLAPAKAWHRCTRSSSMIMWMPR
jgi:carbon starvation protein